jgi:1,4-alpha-glucan branching enzyme
MFLYLHHQTISIMAIQKKFLKSKPLCKVTFSVAAEQVAGADHVAVLGDFNNWDAQAHPMSKLKDGKFKLQLDLPKGEIFEFRYLADEVIWVNDESADAYKPAAIGYDDNCLLVLSEN